LRSYDGLKSQDLEIFLAIFMFLLEKRPLMVTLSEFCSERFDRSTLLW